MIDMALSKIRQSRNGSKQKAPIKREKYLSGYRKVITFAANKLS